MKLGRFVGAIAWVASACLLVATPVGAATGETASARQTLDAGPKMPILAWGGVPPAQSTPERYAELAEAGFNLNYSGAANAETVRKMLDAGRANGVKRLIGLPDLQRDPEGTAKRFKDHPALGGYYLRDELGAKLFPELGALAKRIQAVDAVHRC